MKKVLITGMSGLIGGLLRRHLEDLGGYELTALNRRAVEGVKCFQADITNLEAIKPAFEGQDVVVHLAAYLGNGAFSDDIEGHVAGNVVGVYNVYEAARLAGVKRVVFGSSGSTIQGFELVPPYSDIAAGRFDQVPEDFPMVTGEMVHPRGIYGAAKAWGEQLGHHFSDEYGLSVLCVRIGQVSRGNRPTSSPLASRRRMPTIERSYSVFLSHRDVCQIFQKCIDAPDDLLYDIFMAASNNKWNYRDIEHPRQVLGYVPQDSSDDLR